MKRNLKALGLALGAMFALGAMLGATGASAQDEQFHAEEENVILTGEGGPSVFRVGNESTTNGLPVTCQHSTYEGTVEGKEFDPETETWTTDEVTVHPTYEECVIGSGIGDASVNTDGCDYVLTSGIHEENTGEGHIDKHAQVEVECTDGHTIQIAAPGCTIHIGGGFYEGHEDVGDNTSGDVTENTLTTGVTYENTGGDPNTIEVDATVDSIPYTSSGFLCVRVQGV